MKDNTLLLEDLYEKEKELARQLAAVRQTIIAFGGKTSIKIDEPIKETIAVEPVKVEKVVTPIQNPIEVTSVIPPVITTPEKRMNNSREDIYGFIIEILKEVNAPCHPKVVAHRLTDMKIPYTALTIDAYLRLLEKEGRVIKASPGMFVHKDYVAPQAMTKTVKTIHDVLQYFQMRKEATRQELLKFFVKGGRFNEARLDLRLAKLIEAKQIKRMEAGVYKYIGK